MIPGSVLLQGRVHEHEVQEEQRHEERVAGGVQVPLRESGVQVVRREHYVQEEGAQQEELSHFPVSAPRVDAVEDGAVQPEYVVASPEVEQP